MSVEAIAEGIIRIANEHMAQALRVISVQRGFDPREFTLLSFGGAGGLHVCALAERLGMTQIMVPRHGDVLSALGLLVAPQVQQRSHTRIQRIEEIDIYALTNEYTNMKQRLIDEMQATQAELESTQKVHDYDNKRII